MTVIGCIHFVNHNILPFLNYRWLSNKPAFFRNILFFKSTAYHDLFFLLAAQALFGKGIGFDLFLFAVTGVFQTLYKNILFVVLQDMGRFMEKGEPKNIVPVQAV